MKPSLVSTMPSKFRLSITSKSFIYAVNIFLGATLCWYGLVLVGIKNPIWAIITVILVSDPDLRATVNLSRIRSINTAVGCIISLISLTLFGYTPWGSFLTVGVTIFLVMSIEGYPANWRLAPVTVAIIMDASRVATTYRDEVLFALARAGEIGAGCLVALLVVAVNIRLSSLIRK